MLDVAPAWVQQRTMSRIESTPTSSPRSTTTRWRMPIPTISSARAEAPVRGRRDRAVAHVVGHDLGVEVLATADREQHVALRDDPWRRGLLVEDQRGAGALLGHLGRRLAQRVARAQGQDHARHPLANLHFEAVRSSDIPLASAVPRKQPTGERGGP